MWRTPSAEEVGPRPETLSSADGGPPVIGRRIYRVSPTGRRYNTQQTVGLQAENWPTPQTSDAGGIADERAAALSHTPENQERAQLYRRVAAFTNEESPIWPTPRTKQGHTYRQHAADGRQGLTLEGRAERWPTPREQDSYERRNWKTVVAANRGEKDLTLPSKAAFWSTPRADEREQKNGYDGHPDAHAALSRQAKLWPTPQASEAEKAGPSEDRRRGDTLTKNAEGWPTPRAIYADHPGIVDRAHLSGRAIEMWATPIGRDWKDSGMDPDAATPTNAILGRQVVRTGLPVPGSATNGPGSSPSTPNLPRPRLNPAFVEWLVGVPAGWTDFGPLGTSSSPSRPNSRSGSSTSG